MMLLWLTCSSLFYQFLVYSFKNYQGSSVFSQVSPSSYFERMEGLAENSKHMHEVCDYKNKKSAPMKCSRTPLNYRTFAWIVVLTNLAQKTLKTMNFAHDLTIWNYSFLDVWWGTSNYIILQSSAFPDSKRLMEDYLIV